jgi:hypothetical protein
VSSSHWLGCREPAEYQKVLRIFNAITSIVMAFEYSDDSSINEYFLNLSYSDETDASEENTGMVWRG